MFHEYRKQERNKKFDKFTYKRLNLTFLFLVKLSPMKSNEIILQMTSKPKPNHPPLTSPTRTPRKTLNLQLQFALHRDNSDHLKSIANRQRQPRNVPRKTEKPCYRRERAGGATRSVLKVYTRDREREEARGHETGSEWSTRTQLCRPAQTGCRQIEPRFEFRTTVAARKKPKRNKKRVRTRTRKRKKRQKRRRKDL